MEKIELTTNDWQELTGLTSGAEYLLQNKSGNTILITDDTSTDDVYFMIDPYCFFDWTQSSSNLYIKRGGTTKATIIIQAR